jgi:hypothetical protein
MVQLGVGSPGAGIIGRLVGPFASSGFIMQPARMQMQLHIVPCVSNSPGDTPHRFETEIGGLKCLDKKSGVHPELGEAVEQKAEAMFLPFD